MTSAIRPFRRNASRLGSLASLASILAALNGCDGDNYYPGVPLSNAAVTLVAVRLPDSASTARFGYTARWRILDDDFRRYPYLLEIKHSFTGQHIDIRPKSPADSAIGTFACTGTTCSTGQFSSILFAELEKGKLLVVGSTFTTMTR
jgi:hypothetical protein